VLRTPLLPFDELEAWGDGLEAPAAVEGDEGELGRALARDKKLLRRRLTATLGRPEVREALFIAAPGVHDSIEAWNRDPDDRRGRKLERALVRYLFRMAARPTPFGLFAGYSLGSVGEETSLRLSSRGGNRRATRLDFGYLSTLVEALVDREGIRHALPCRPNSSLYRAAGRLHYISFHNEGGQRWNRLVAVEETEPLAAVLRLAGRGATPAALADELAGMGPSPAEARAFVDALIESRLLVSDLEPPVTGGEPLAAILARLESVPDAAPVVSLLTEAQTALRELDRDGTGLSTERYAAARQGLERLEVAVEPGRLFRIDLMKPGPGLELGRDLVDELRRGVSLLNRLTRPGDRDALYEVRRAFRDRFEEREVPLVEAFDDEVGIGLDELPAPIGAVRKPDSDRNSERSWTALDELLLNEMLVAAHRGDREIILDEARVSRTVPLEDAPPLPDAFAVVATVSSASERSLRAGDFLVFLHGAFGPSGARLLGRFCGSDPELRRAVEGHLRAEEKLDPGAAFAEIAHLPQGHLGNVTHRPGLRDLEIDYVGPSGIPPERRVAVQDLLVSLVGDRFVLRSRRLGVRIVPRLTSAVSLQLPGLPLFRFLGFLQYQGCRAALTFDWGRLASADFLPRLRVGRTVVAPARWKVTGDQSEGLRGLTGPARFQQVQRWREEWGLPRFVDLFDGDRSLTHDLDNPLGVDSLSDLLGERGGGSLMEPLAAPNRLCAHGPEGRYVHELVVPFIQRRGPRPGPAAATSPPAESVGPSESRFRRSFPPGTTWLYFKLHGGFSAVDRLLCELVGPLCARLLTDGVAERWFFVRYGDPDYHLRLRLEGPADQLHDVALGALQTGLEPYLEDGSVWRVQLDTYEREVERYGGPEGILTAERLFHLDSEAAVEAVTATRGDSQGRWRLALLGVDALLGDLRFEVARKVLVVDQLRDHLHRLVAPKERLSDLFRQSFRTQRADLEALLASSGPSPPGAGALETRSSRSKSVIAELLESERAGRLTRRIAGIAGSLAHLHVNRMLSAAPRQEELRMYDHLARLYRSQTARERKNPA
jgi:thiopeptide-type bacteriocin biosynthesis protein